ncbi:MAG: alpha-L-fucosidase [Clostridia bacterium]
MKTIKEYLDIVDEVISNGKFKDDWQSLSAFEMPKWYQKGRFGLFIHWGCYSLPATESEWYPRLMYIKGTKSWEQKCSNLEQGQKAV